MAASRGSWQVQRGIWKLKTTCASLGVVVGLGSHWISELPYF